MNDNRGQDYVGAPPPGSASAKPSGERRVALVIGNGSYRHTTRLSNPGNDARSLAAKLAGLGFEVVGGAGDGIDLDYGSMAARIRDFGRRLRDGADTALLFFAGHGIQVHGRNYLVPVDATLELESDVGSELFELQSLLNQMEKRDRTSIVILDACRNNPLAQNLARAMGLSDARSAGITEGLAEQRVVAGTLIAYATQPGHVAYDGDGEHGFFTEALLNHIDRPGLDVELMLRDVRGHVLNATGNKRLGPQVPWVHSSILGSFYFRPLATSGSAPSDARQPTPGPVSDLLSWSRDEWTRLEASTDIEKLRRFAERADPYYAHEARDRIAALEVQARQAAEAEAEAKRRAEEATKHAEQQELARRYAADWDTAKREGTIAAYERFLAAWTGGAHESEAKQKLAALKAEAELRPKASYPVRVGTGANDKTVHLAPGQSIKDADFAPEMVLVPPGKFWMGSKDGEGVADERPRHEVKIDYPLLVGKYPVTFDEWDAYVAQASSGGFFGIGGGTPHKPGDEGWGSGKRPVINVSWHDAKAYVAWLSRATGKQYRLLSEAEWEYACRSGSIGKWSFGDDESKLADHAWYSANSGGKTQPVGGKPPNQFSLYDMHGNVWEWCEDAWADTYQGAPADGSPRQSADTSVSRGLRGGSWFGDPRHLRSAYRFRYPPEFRYWDLGFRLARTLPPTP